MKRTDGTEAKMEIRECDDERRVRKVRSDATGRTPRTARKRVRPNREKRADRESRLRPFVAWDGEGYTVESGNHYYSLFGNSLGVTVTGPNLTWRDTLPLLMNAPKMAYHVIFAGTYDFVMQFRNRPEISALLHGHTVNIENYRLRFLRGKMLTVTDMETKQTRTLYDVFSFFQCSFVKACREYLGTSELLDEIEAMKAQRNTFTADMGDDVKRYMMQELEMLVALCARLRDMLDAVGIRPARWHGPGAVASNVMRNHGIKSAKGQYDIVFREIAERAYYGGRFEQFRRGRINGTVYQYDIRSAYPAAMVTLPNLANVTWQRVERPRTISPYALCYIETPNRYEPTEIGWLPHRGGNGNIYYPSWAKGWYWGVEIPDQWKRYVRTAYTPTGPGMTERPFAFVLDMYRQRAALKAAGKPEQLALKLALNSLYGKLAQSTGATVESGEWKYPPFHEPVWAGYITAFTRARIAQALHSVPIDMVIATETDSVFSRAPLSLDIGTGLGQWESSTLDDLIYLQSGVSIAQTDGTWGFKTRGFTFKNSAQVFDKWMEILETGEPMRLSQTNFITDPRRERFGQWHTSIREINIHGSTTEKRIHARNACPECAESTSMATVAHRLIVPPIPHTESTPYDFLWRTDGSRYADDDNPTTEITHTVEIL